MKTLFKFRLKNYFASVLLLTGLLVFSGMKSADAKTQNMGVSFQIFYDALMPFGDWVNDPNYGYIWIPYVESGFQPYRTNGYWVNSRFGNTWVSQYEWGWAPFHYGRWFFDDFYGWAWVPGYEWGPAWVEWRTGRGYYGWAPIWPRVGVHVSFHMPYHHWVFVPRRRFLARNFYNYCLPPRNVGVIYNQTTIINNTYVYNNRTYMAGPSRRELQRVTRGNVPVYEVANSRSPGRTNVANNRLNLYRPQLENSNTSRRGGMARPERVMTTDEFRARRGNTSSLAQERGGRSAEVGSAQARNSSDVALPNASARRAISDQNATRPSSRTAQPQSSRTREQGNSAVSRRELGATSPSNTVSSRNRPATSPNSNARINETRRQVNPNSQRASIPNTPSQRYNTPPASTRNAGSGTAVKRDDTNTRSVSPSNSRAKQVRPQATPQQRQMRQAAPRESRVRPSTSYSQRQVSPSSSRAPQVRSTQPSSRNRSGHSSVGRSSSQVRSSSGTAPSRSSRSSGTRASSRSRGN